jgi:hypothetical protein
MRPFRFSFHPLLLAAIGVASGALALGASTVGSRFEPLRSEGMPGRRSALQAG